MVRICIKDVDRFEALLEVMKGAGDSVFPVAVKVIILRKGSL